MPGKSTPEPRRCVSPPFFHSSYSYVFSPYPHLFFPPERCFFFIYLVRLQTQHLPASFLQKTLFLCNRYPFSFPLPTPLPLCFLPHLPFLPKPVVQSEGFLQEKRWSRGSNSFSIKGDPGLGRGRQDFGQSILRVREVLRRREVFSLEKTKGS